MSAVPLFGCCYLEFQVDGITTTVADHRADYWLAGDLAPAIGLAQVPLCDVTDVVDESGRLCVARNDEVQFHQVAAGVSR